MQNADVDSFRVILVVTMTTPTTSTTTTIVSPSSTTTTTDIRNKKDGNFLTRSIPFRLLVDKAFAVCDGDKTGHICKTELYAGLLLVHLNLAKHAGPAACYPPTRAVVDQLFDAADVDHSGTIDKDEFVKIMAITCAQILGRMMVYYLILILLVPLLAAFVVDRLATIIPNQSTSYGEMAAEQTIGMILFFFVIPVLWNHIDQFSQHRLTSTKQATASILATNTTTTTTTTTLASSKEE